MRAYELFEEDDNLPDGTYAGVKLSSKSVKAIADYCEGNNLPNPTPPEKLHVTLLYSRKYLPDYEAYGLYKEPLIGKPDGFDVWESSPEDPDEKPSRCLVLKIDCEELVKRHKKLMKEHGATFDYDEYNPHVTFSYDIENIDEKDLPPFTKPIVLVKEYQEDLNLDWAEDNTK